MNFDEWNSKYSEANEKSNSVTNYQPGKVAPISRYTPLIIILAGPLIERHADVASLRIYQRHPNTLIL